MKRTAGVLLLVGAAVIALLSYQRMRRGEREAIELSHFAARQALKSAPPTPNPPSNTAAPAPDAMVAPLTTDQNQKITRAEQADGSKIVGGEPADPSKYPWIAAIGMRDEKGNVASYCAGTLIAPQWLLTGAHCKVVEGDYAVLGRSDLATAKGHVVKIVRVLPHRQYDRTTLDYDVALAKLETAVSDISPLNPIPECHAHPEGGAADNGVSAAPAEDCDAMVRRAGTLSIAGWGRLGEFLYQTPNKLQRAEVFFSSRSSCVGNYAQLNKVVTQRMFCAQGVNKDGQVTDACKGDSGGPIVAYKNNIAVLVGVISKGDGCAASAYPGIYAHLSLLRGWVDQCMKEPEPAECS